MATIVKCNLSLCIHNEGGECQHNIIYVGWQDGCEDYKDITEQPDYKNIFYKAYRCRHDGEIYRLRAYGKRFMHEELVFYAESDYRDDDTALYEEKSGLQACSIKSLQNKEAMCKVRNALQIHFETRRPIIEYPDYIHEIAS